MKATVSSETLIPLYETHDVGMTDNVKSNIYIISFKNQRKLMKHSTLFLFSKLLHI